MFAVLITRDLELLKNQADETESLPEKVGLRRMTDFATAWLAFGPQDGSSCV